MNAVTSFCLRRRRLVALAWLVLTVAGALLASSATGRLTHSFATPGTAGYDTNLHLLQTFGIDGNEQPTIAVLKLPAGESMRTAAGQNIAARTFAAANQAGHLAAAVPVTGRRSGSGNPRPGQWRSPADRTRDRSCGAAGG